MRTKHLRPTVGNKKKQKKKDLAWECYSSVWMYYYDSNKGVGKISTVVLIGSGLSFGLMIMSFYSDNYFLSTQSNCLPIKKCKLIIKKHTWNAARWPTHIFPFA